MGRGLYLGPMAHGKVAASAEAAARSPDGDIEYRDHAYVIVAIPILAGLHYQYVRI
jgi:hypothetical protein